MNNSEKFWDKRAQDYDRQNKKYELKHNKAVENTIKYIENNQTVLDFGCGYGLITANIAGYVKSVHGIDISSEMIGIASKKAEEHNIKNVIYTKSTIFDDTLKEESFDVILAYNILHLLDNIQETLIRINKLLKPGGLLISETVCLGEKKSFVSVFLVFLCKIKVVPHIEMLTFSELDEIIVKNRFQIIETKDLEQSSKNYFIVAKKI